ncbi:hypothetical protein J6590_033557 [Homalodisca vitripennis]|nr:hypothetical protein J6590_033557 [Homalodisca vitripennis]
MDIFQLQSLVPEILDYIKDVSRKLAPENNFRLGSVMYLHLPPYKSDGSDPSPGKIVRKNRSEYRQYIRHI